jgi:hypothetical protein
LALAKLWFDIDEGGLSDWEKHKARCVLISTEAKDDTCMAAMEEFQYQIPDGLLLR